MRTLTRLSRRERQVMDILYRAGAGTVSDVRDAMADPPSYSAVRATMRILEEKGHLKHEDDGTRYVYRPAVGRSRAQRGAVNHLVETFFAGSPAGLVKALLEQRGEISPEELERMARMIETARQEGR